MLDEQAARWTSRAARRSVAVAALMTAVLVTSLAAPAVASATVTVRTEVLVYGGTPAGVLAAVTASRGGARVTLLEPSRHLGGMMASGLSWTDIGDKATIGGYTRELFGRIVQHHGTASARYAFEAHAAEAAFLALLRTTTVRVRYAERLAKTDPIRKDGARILWIRSASGTIYRASVFIDASYEGDLLARAGVTSRIGRESSAEYGESLAGVRPAQVVIGDLAGITVPFASSAPGPIGSADKRIQASNFRVCFSSDPAEQAPFTAPASYDPAAYDVILRYLDDRATTSGLTPRLDWLIDLKPLPNDEWDVNDRGLMSTALPGGNWSWATLDAAGRAKVAGQHRRWALGLFYFLVTDPRVPASIGDALSDYGLCADEYADNGHWPRQLYIREARRMVGWYVMTQADLMTRRQKSSIIAIGSYRVDSHLVSRWIDERGRLMTEGSLGDRYRDYAIPYRAITPKAAEATNLLVPVAMSASHVAQSSLRMEPHYMLLGEAAGQAAAMAIRHSTLRSDGVPSNIAVQQIDVAALQAKLIRHGSILTNPT